MADVGDKKPWDGTSLVEMMREMDKYIKPYAPTLEFEPLAWEDGMEELFEKAVKALLRRIAATAATADDAAQLAQALHVTVAAKDMYFQKEDE